MTQLSVPIELSDEELLLVVSGGRGCGAAGVAQVIRQDAVIVQRGGSVSIGGGNGSFSGNLTLVETFVAVIAQAATNVNIGNVTVTVTV
jgi:hypothetical protein